MNKDSCLSNDDFYCHKSRTCVPKSYKCDGSVNCLHGEDEELEECKSTFSEGATLECEEAYRPGFSITVYAVPCDGIVGELHLKDWSEFNPDAEAFLKPIKFLEFSI